MVLNLPQHNVKPKLPTQSTTQTYNHVRAPWHNPFTHNILILPSKNWHVLYPRQKTNISFVKKTNISFLRFDTSHTLLRYVFKYHHHHQIIEMCRYTTYNKFLVYILRIPLETDREYEDTSRNRQCWAYIGVNPVIRR